MNEQKHVPNWEHQDIRLWYAYHDGVCPNCGLDMKSCFPLYNIYPHWSAQCKKMPEEKTLLSEENK